MSEHLEHTINKALTKLEHFMATLEDTLTAQTGILNQILQAVQALSPAKAEDLTPVTSALTEVQASLASLQSTTTAIAAKLPATVAQ